MWGAVCRLVSVIRPEEVSGFIEVNGAPLPLPQGGVKAGKAGEWSVNSDGSGTWTRWDRAATRYSSLYSSGPSRQECHTRETFDTNSGEKIGTMNRFDVAKNLNEPLPPPVPRDTRTVFHFNRTSKAIPDSARASGEVAAVAWRPSLRLRRR